MNVVSPPSSPKEVVLSEQKVCHSRTVVPLNITTDVFRAAECLRKAFKDSKANDYLLKKFFNIPLTENCSKQRLDSILLYYLTLYSDFGGEIVEANDFDAVAVWTTPGRHFHQAPTNDPAFNKVFFEDLEKRQKEVIPEGVGYYYLFIIGKDLTQPEVRGSVRKIFETYKQRADAENCALVLEAISDTAKSVYEYFGFKNYLTFNYGVNEADSNGKYDPTGEGFTAYFMLYYKDELPGAII